MSGLSCYFTVDGVPVAQGSMRAFARGGHAVVTHTNRPNLGAWRQAVAARATQAMVATPTYRGAVQVAMDFKFPHPSNHYGTGRNAGVLKASAPDFMATSPDIDKLVRAVLDAITGVVIADDRQVVALVATKLYADHPGLTINVFSAEEA